MKISTPDIDNDLTAGRLENLVHLKTLDDVLVQNQEADNLTAQNAEITGCKFVSIITQKASLEGSVMRDVEISSSNMSISKISDGNLTRVGFIDCRLEGVDFANAQLQDVTFLNCNLNMTNFSMAQVRSVVFQGCSIIDAEFMASQLKEVRFVDCQIENANFTEAKLTEVDLSGSNLINIEGVLSLKGATIDSAQLHAIAPELAATLGIVVI